MSMILDALRKSDRERSRGAADRLREGPALAGRPGMDERLLIVLAAALLLAIGAAAIALWPDGPSADRTAAGEAAEIMENERVPRIREVRAPVRDLAGELVRTAPLMTPEPAEPGPVESTPSPSTAQWPSRRQIIENLSAPPLEALPAAIRIRIPRLHVDVHAWAEDPRDRFVLINLRRYQEGDRLQEGPILHRIMRNGVVLEFEGTLFTLPRQ